MKKNKLFLILFTLKFFLISCNSKKEKDPMNDLFEPSYKEQKKNIEFSEYFDSLSNIYSNYKYNIAIRSPKNWKRDEGVSEHSIFRAIELDSGYSFSVNVIETKYNVEVLWPEYKKNRELIEQQTKTLIEKSVNSVINSDYSEITYLKNIKCLKRKYNFAIKEDEYEYQVIMIVYTVFRGNLTYTITLSVPKIFYDERSEYFDDISNDIFWLGNKENIKSAVNKLSNKK